MRAFFLWTSGEQLKNYTKEKTECSKVSILHSSVSTQIILCDGNTVCCYGETFQFDTERKWVFYGE